jgi:hypothetical protein
VVEADAQVPHDVQPEAAAPQVDAMAAVSPAVPAAGDPVDASPEAPLPDTAAPVADEPIAADDVTADDVAADDTATGDVATPIEDRAEETPEVAPAATASPDLPQAATIDPIDDLEVPQRFSWRLDANLRFHAISPESVAAPAEATFEEALGRFGLDPQGALAAAVAGTAPVQRRAGRLAPRIRRAAPRRDAGGLPDAARRRFSRLCRLRPDRRGIGRGAPGDPGSDRRRFSRRGDGTGDPVDHGR